jgi:propionyl-CoA carboxylase alpha chain
MPGTVVAVAVQVGQAVEAGDPLITVEAMKMEHTLRAPAPGVVTEVRVAPSAQVRLDEELVVVDLTAVEGDDLP